MEKRGGERCRGEDKAREVEELLSEASERSEQSGGLVRWVGGMGWWDGLVGWAGGTGWLDG